MTFYAELAAMASELLAPAASGGLGQGTVQLVRVTAGAPAANPWETVAPTTTTETLRAAVRGVSKALLDADSQLVATDLQVIAAVPTGGAYKVGDRLTIDGAPVTVLRYDQLPAAGTPAAVRFVVRN